MAEYPGGTGVWVVIYYFFEASFGLVVDLFCSFGHDRKNICIVAEHQTVKIYT